MYTCVFFTQQAGSLAGRYRKGIICYTLVICYINLTETLHQGQYLN